jgi:putative transposase
MACYLRPRLPGVPVFFTVCLAQRGATALVDHIDALRLAVAQTRAERPFVIDAFVVLPDHLHCIWTLPDGDYSTRWGAIKARFTRRVRDGCRVGFHPTRARAAGQPVGWNPTLPRSRSKIAKGDAGLWQRRFWDHHIRDEQAYQALLRYCYWNPVRHALVDHPEAWPFSSIHRDRRMGLLDEDGLALRPAQLPVQPVGWVTPQPMR